MSAKRIQLADGTWQALDLFSRDSTKTFQERADESFADLLAKPGRPQRGAASGAGKHGRAISGRKWAGSVTGSKGGVVCALA